MVKSTYRFRQGHHEWMCSGGRAECAVRSPCRPPEDETKKKKKAVVESRTEAVHFFFGHIHSPGLIGERRFSFFKFVLHDGENHDIQIHKDPSGRKSLRRLGTYLVTGSGPFSSRPEEGKHPCKSSCRCDNPFQKGSRAVSRAKISRIPSLLRFFLGKRSLYNPSN